MKLNTLVGSLVLGASLCTPSFGGGLLDRMLGMKGAGCDSACCDTGISADPSCGVEISAANCDTGCADACAPAHHHGLLSRLKGHAGHRHCGHADPSCGCEIAAPVYAAAPSCGVEIAGPACGGCASDPCCDDVCQPRRRPLMELVSRAKHHAHKLGGHNACDCGVPSCGCEIAAPACGSGCDNGCGHGHGFGAGPSCGVEIAACDPCAPAGCDSLHAKKCGGLLSKLFHRKHRGGCDSLGCDTVGCSSCGSGNVTYGSSAPVAAPVVNGDAAPVPPAPIVDPSAYLQSNRRVIQATSYVR